MVDSVSTVIHLSNDILLFYCKYWKLKAGKANMQHIRCVEGPVGLKQICAVFDYRPERK
jgi:hypothetical protein